MANVKVSFVGGTTPVTLTVTGLSALATGTSATSAVVDNHTNLTLDYIVVATLGTASATNSGGYCEVYLQSSNDNTTFPDVTNDVLLEVISMSSVTTPVTKTFTVAKGLQGFTSNYFKLRFNNQSGQTFNSATVSYLPAFVTSA